MTPQQLSDLPYAGDAERVLRASKQWAMTDLEALKDAQKSLDQAGVILAGSITKLGETT